MDTFARHLVELMPRLLMGLLREERSLISLGVISVPQAWTLLRLEESGPCSMRDLARALRLTPPTVTSLVGRLVKVGLAVRRLDPADRRVVRASITPRGKELLGRVRRKKEESARRLFRAVPAADRQAFVVLLETFMNRLLSEEAKPETARTGRRRAGAPGRRRDDTRRPERGAS